MQEKRLIIKPEANPDDIRQLQKDLNIDPVLAGLLAQRGIRNFDEAKAFFRPNLDDLYNPFLMQDMLKAVSRLNFAIEKGEKILVYGDYDVDGTTSVALVYSFLRDFTSLGGVSAGRGGQFPSNIDFYVPDRYKEGYGISFAGIDYAEKNGISLVIALDCGIKAIDKVEYANQKGIDFIICDHHTPGEQIPDAVAVLDPKRSDCNYPYKHLSGCGVGFKFMQAFADRNKLPFEKLLNYLDLVAVSIAADIVPITDENRILAHYGLKKLNSAPIEGLKALIEISRAQGKVIDINDCVFKIGPRINAAGRIRSAREAVNLLIETDARKANAMAVEIETANDQRKDIDKSIHFEAIGMIGNSEDFKNRKTTVIYKPDWHKGVIGIVASRLIETYYRPTVVLTESNGFANGSARSVKDFDLYAAIDACSHLLKNFGGHKYAAGLTLKIENIDAFKDCFDKYAQENLLPEQEKPAISVDAVIDFADITPKFYRILKQFAPFGPGNMRPVFLTKQVKDAGSSRAVGQSHAHLKLNMKDANNKILDGIGFSMGDFFEVIKNNNAFDVCYTLDENFFRNTVSIQARVKYLQASCL